MMKKSALLVAGLGLMALGTAATTAHAAPDPTNKWEVTLGGLGQNDVDFNGTAFSVQGSVGYYVTDQFEVAVRQTYQFADNGGPGSSWNAGTRLALDYHFDLGQDQNIIPFVGLVGGYVYGDGVADTLTAGAEAGVKFYVNDTTFIYGTATYEFLFDEDDNNVGDQAEDGQFLYTVGVGFRF